MAKGPQVYFAHPLEIESILRRVMRANPLSIFDSLGGRAADLFLVNPNGVMFGENATLDILGSFCGIAAEQFCWAMGYSIQYKPICSPSLKPSTATVQAVRKKLGKSQ